MAKTKLLTVNRLGAEILVRHLARRDAPWLPVLDSEKSHHGNIWLAQQSHAVVTYGDAAGSTDAERQASARATAKLVDLGLMQRSGRKYCDVITPAGERYARGIGWPFLASQAAEALARLAALTEAGDCSYQTGGGRWDRNNGAGAAHERQGYAFATLIAGTTDVNALFCLSVCLIPFVRAGLVGEAYCGDYYRLTGDAVTAEQIAAIVPADDDRNYDDELGGVYFDQLEIARRRILDEPREINELGAFTWNLGIMGSSRKADDFRGAEPIFPKPMPGEINSPSGDVAA